ncbi:MAG: M48 family metallopeptidase [Bacteroidales bacterium]|nr:M48 family metallopeptidase [Bacteroidales bacterium]MCL2133158.1 M48 family metallopeptidase [Bacteroidales bacterium]
MQYIGLHKQQARNNFRSVLLLCLFPCLVIALTYLFCLLFILFTSDNEIYTDVLAPSLLMLQYLLPFVLVGVALWFLIAYFANTAIIRSATGAHSLKRKANKRVYNLVENLCMAQGMPMPKVNVIEDDSLNAYASGINKRSYTVTLTRGIINKLDDDELEGVIAHELSHIRNRDVRLLIVSIVFVGIFAMLAQLAFRMLIYSPRRSSNNKDGKGAGVIILIALAVAIVGYFFASLMRFAISRKREYLADASAAEMTRRPRALAGALRKISQDPNIEAVTNNDVAQLFIEHPQKKRKGQALSGLSGLFATHPPIKKRIALLEQF